MSQICQDDPNVIELLEEKLAYVKSTNRTKGCIAAVQKKLDLVKDRKARGFELKKKTAFESQRRTFYYVEVKIE